MNDYVVVDWKDSSKEHFPTVLETEWYNHYVHISIENQPSYDNEGYNLINQGKI